MTKPSDKKTDGEYRAFNLHFAHGACDVEAASDVFIEHEEVIPVIEKAAFNALLEDFNKLKGAAEYYEDKKNVHWENSEEFPDSYTGMNCTDFIYLKSLGRRWQQAGKRAHEALSTVRSWDE